RFGLQIKWRRSPAFSLGHSRLCGGLTSARGRYLPVRSAAAVTGLFFAATIRDGFKPNPAERAQNQMLSAKTGNPRPQLAFCLFVREFPMVSTSLWMDKEVLPAGMPSKAERSATSLLSARELPGCRRAYELCTRGKSVTAPSGIPPSQISSFG